MRQRDEKGAISYHKLERSDNGVGIDALSARSKVAEFQAKLFLGEIIESEDVGWLQVSMEDVSAVDKDDGRDDHFRQWL